MSRASLICAALAAIAIAGCQGPAYAGFPPLPRPSPDAEAVAVSTDIASPERPVFYYRDSENGRRLLAYDWSGVFRGSLTVAASEPFGVYPSADGTVLLVTHGHIVSGGRVLGKLASGTWAGDNAHICAFLNQLGGPASTRTRQISPNEFETIATPGALFYESVTGKSRKVLDYGQFGPEGGPAILACNAGKDRAVIGGSFVAEVSGITMIRLSDGKLIASTLGGSHRGADGTLVSADATLVAQGSTGGVSMGAAADDFSVYRIPANEFVAEVHGSVAELFSADGSRILSAEDIGGSNEHRRYSVTDLTTAKTLWTAVLSPGTILARPGSGDFLVASRTRVANPSRPNDAAQVFEDVWVIAADGSAKQLLTHASPLQ